MTKRQLDSKYRDLADWVKQVKHSDDTSHSLAFLLSCIYDFRNKGKISDILNDLNEDLTLISSNDLIPIITDIYNDNYELAEPKYYWKLNINSNGGDHLYAFRYIIPQNTIGVKKFNGSVDSNTLDKFNKSKLTELLNNTDTTLTIFDFTPVEEIKND